MTTYIIFDGTHVKIGRSDNVWGRIAGLQTASSTPLTLLLELPGDREAELHELFAEHRVRGEWFEYAYAIRKFVASCSHTRLRMPFYVWLQGQRHRQDDTGRFAVIACADRTFNKDANQLYALRAWNGRRQPKLLLRALDQAHAEWRRECAGSGNHYLRTAKNSKKRLEVGK